MRHYAKLLKYNKLYLNIIFSIAFAVTSLGGAENDTNPDVKAPGTEHSANVIKVLAFIKERNAEEAYKFCKTLSKDEIYNDFALCHPFAVSIIMYKAQLMAEKKTLTGDDLFEIGWAVGFIDRMSYADPDNKDQYNKVSNFGASIINRYYTNAGNTTAAVFYKLSISQRP
jgi:hypothetical protein